jgi:aerobic-type carbon monoxide dehydrogenase small subunit (CoxS/CutS family)
MILTFWLNGHAVEISTEPDQILLTLLRDSLGITSCKEGCGEGECGACSVFLNDRLVNACLIPAIMANGAKIMTLEGVMEETEPLRESFIRHDALQCGFCTPGFVMAAYDYLRHGGEADSTIVALALDGNLCRCTGYQNIIDAIVEVAKENR